MELIKEQSDKSKVYSVKMYNTIKEVSRILKQDYTIEIIFHLSQEPMRYKQIKKSLKCTDSTLSRRLKELQKCRILERLPVILGNKKSHEYAITGLGQELIKFFRDYANKSSNLTR